jgi:replicative DNA helicase
MKEFSDLEQEQALAIYDGEDKVIPGNELLEQLKKRPRPKVFFESKIPKLDERIDGFFGGQLIVVSGITGQGKTTFCQTMTYAAESKGLLSTWFSYELDMEDFLGQFKGDTVHNILLPSLLKGRSPEWIEMRTWESKLKYKANVVFIDHLHFLIDLQRSRNISFDVGSVVRSLKLLAIKHNIIVFLICHTMKTKADSDIELGLGDVRDSSLIEQEADLVLYVWRDPNSDNRSILKIAKNRRRGIINKKIRLTFQGGRLYEEQGEPEENTGVDTRDRSRMGQGKKKGVFVQPDNRYGA